MTDYLFLYRGAERPTSPQDTQQIMQKWMSWLQELSDKGHLKDRGQPLEATGKIVRKKSVTDGPFAETKDLVGGYSIVQAKDLSQAAELSKGCPIFDADGYVEVRPVMSM